MEAKIWLREIKKTFEVVVGEYKKTIFDAYMLNGEASYWWEVKQVLEESGVTSWIRFTKLLLEKYLPKNLENQIELNMSLSICQ